MTTRTITRWLVRRWRRVAGQAGSATVELVYLALPLMILVLVGVAVDRQSRAEITVHGATAAAARAASLARTPGAGAANARDVATTSLSGQTWTCVGGPAVSTSGSWGPGGVVSVTVTCRVPMADLGLRFIPGSRTLTHTAASPVETYKSTP